MMLLRGFDEPDCFRGGVVAIGNFDGVHRGHQSMIARLVARAKDAGVAAVVLTFEPHPIQLLRPDRAPPRLVTLEGKAELLARFGVGCVIAYPTDWDLLRLSPQEFFDRVVLDQLDARGLVEGPNFHFGRNRAGNVQTLHALCAAAGRELEVVPPVEIDGRLVSSSSVRSLIADGQIADANRLLGHNYRVQGIVGMGAQRGRRLGFPTANLSGIETLIPRDGVYAGRCRTQGTSHAAAIHVGPNATFGESQRHVEVHLIDFEGDLYGQRLDVEFVERLRETRKFGGPDELQQQLRRDVQAARDVAKRGGTD